MKLSCGMAKRGGFAASCGDGAPEGEDEAYVDAGDGNDPVSGIRQTRLLCRRIRQLILRSRGISFGFWPSIAEAPKSCRRKKKVGMISHQQRLKLC
ncbi:hypothetical protein ER57_10890 [Smithella sp. SCADC]|nr:hypothetical protein ER57_10890 [Smithella sp. SCADC]